MIRKTAIVGMGALGLMYGDQIVSGLQDPDAVVFVMDPVRSERHKADIYTINGKEQKFRILSSEETAPVDLVILAVKYNQMEDAMKTMEGLVGDTTIILSVMNGVTTEKILAQRFGAGHILDTVAQGMDAMREGTNLRYTRCGELHIGASAEVQEKNLEAVEEFFIRAKVPYIREEDITRRMWFKFMLNVGINQTCLAFDTVYRDAITPETKSNEAMMGAMKEVLLLAQKKEIPLEESDLDTVIRILATLDPLGYPSMAQDGKAHRPSEVEMFAGEVIKMAEEYGMEVPYNRYFYKCIKEIEAAY